MIKNWKNCGCSGERSGFNVAVLILAVLLFQRTSFAEEGEDNIGAGYLAAPTMSVGHILRPNSLFMAPNLDSVGARSVDVGVHGANVWNQDKDHFLLDGEWWRIETRLQYAFKETMSLGVILPVVGRTGGASDKMIEKFHSAFGLGNESRGYSLRNKSLQQVTTRDGRRTIVEGEDWGMGDIGGFYIWRLSDGDATHPAVRLQVKLSAPSGDESQLEGLGEPAASVGAVVSKRLWQSPFLVVGGADFSYSSADYLGGIPLCEQEYSGLMGLEYQYSHVLSLVSQYLVTSPLAEDYYAFSKSTHEWAVGFKWKAGPLTDMEFSLVENLVTLNNSADVSMHLDWSRKF